MYTQPLEAIPHGEVDEWEDPTFLAAWTNLSLAGRE